MTITEAEKSTTSRQDIVRETKRQIMEREDKLDAEIIRKRLLERIAAHKPKTPK